MWNALEQAQSVAAVAGGGGGGAVTGGMTAGVGGGMTGDPLWLSSLSSALHVGDAEFWEESISPSTIRVSLSSCDPGNPSHTSALLRGMKWLLANMSKGRDVSDFYPHVVKLVTASSLEVRKLVYLYLVQYADHSPETRELSLLSINSFQRGLGDPEQWIRGLALRVLTSIRLPDILQIQILAAQRSAGDVSPYVRKCAANALVKLHRAIDSSSRKKTSAADKDNDGDRSRRQQREIIVELLVELLEREESTMVLTSALIAFSELQLDLALLHTSFRKVCDLLTDMDEWGQVVVLDLLTRYCRTYFRRPPEGAAERIDREKRVVGARTVVPVALATEMTEENVGRTDAGAPVGTALTAESAAAGASLPPYRAQPQSASVTKIKRRVVRKGFYSDEEDSSTEEEVYENPLGQIVPSISQALREQPVFPNPSAQQAGVSGGSLAAVSELESLAPDHRLLLTSAMPLLKSRNAGVVLAVCGLAYYCGIASIPTRVAVGKALVRISRDRREIQYVVLTSIRTLAAECPSAFTPYLSDFFVTAMDPEFTKLIKLDILTLLALEPKAIERVLTEFRAYAVSSEQPFAVAAIRSVGKVAEMARRVHDRHGLKHAKAEEERRRANATALNCLYGLVTLSQVSGEGKAPIVGECVIAAQHMLQMLNSDDVAVEDPNHVRARALNRILLLVIGSLSARAVLPQPQDDSEDGNDDDCDSRNSQLGRLSKLTTKNLPPSAAASGLWIMGEFLASPTFSPSPALVFGGDAQRVASIRLELVRLVARAFPDLDPVEKEQGVHLASKLLLSAPSGLAKEAAICEHVLAMGRLDLNPDLRDRARFESGLIHLSLGLAHDVDALETPPSAIKGKLSVDQARQILLRRKLASNSLTGGAGAASESFRFGTLSSLVGHRARNAYVPLPTWAEKDSPSSLRDPPERKPSLSQGPDSAARPDGGFYGSSSSSESSGSADDSSSSTSSSDEDDSRSASSDDSSTTSSEDDASSSRDANLLQISSRTAAPPIPRGLALQPTQKSVGDASSSSENDSSSSTSSSDGDDSGSSSPQSMSIRRTTPAATDASLISLGGGGTVIGPASSSSLLFQGGRPVDSVSELSDDLKGLILFPVAHSSSAASGSFAGDRPGDTERDSGAWLPLVRSDLAGGLSVQARYLRGAARTRESLSLGLLVSDATPNVVCLQVRFENHRKGGGAPFRRLKLHQRSSISTSGSAASSSVMGPRKIVAPPEIPQLDPGQRVDRVLGIEFSGVSDRDGSLLAKMDVQFGTGSVPIEIRPTVGDLLQPPSSLSSTPLTGDLFDAAIRNLQGFQRIESRFEVPAGTSAVKNLSGAGDLAARRITDHVALVPVGDASTASSANSKATDLKLRFVGYLPSAGDPVYVLLTLVRSSNTEGEGEGEGGGGGGGGQRRYRGKAVVCCVQPLAVNSIMNQVKRALNGIGSS
jgi:AP-3 complex subunit beta